MKKISLIVLIFLSVIGLIFGGCAKQAPTPTPTPAPAPVPAGPKEILIGFCVPMTGMFAGFGQQAFGVQAAIDDINKQGGVYVKEFDRKIPVRLIVVNNESDPAKVGSLTEDLALRDKVNVLISPDEPCTLHNDISRVGNKYKIPQIICGGPFEPWYHGMREAVEGHWPYTWFAGFSIATPQAPPRNVPGFTCVDTWFMYMDKVGAKTNTNMVAGVFASDDPDGIGWYATFPPELKKYGCTVVGVDKELGMFPMGTTDFTSIIDQWKAAGVQILWGNCPGPDFGTLWSQCYAKGFRPKIVLCGRAPLFPVDVVSWGTKPPLGWGVGVECWWSPAYPPADFPGIGSTTAASLADKYLATGQALNRGIGHGYVGAQIMFDAIQRAGSLNGDAINTALGKTDMKSINGWIKFDPESHFSAMPLALGQWFYEPAKAQPWTEYIVCSALSNIPEEAKPLFPIPGLYP